MSSASSSVNSTGARPSRRAALLPAPATAPTAGRNDSPSSRSNRRQQFLRVGLARLFKFVELSPHLSEVLLEHFVLFAPLRDTAIEFLDAEQPRVDLRLLDFLAGRPDPSDTRAASAEPLRLHVGFDRVEPLVRQRFECRVFVEPACELFGKSGDCGYQVGCSLPGCAAQQFTQADQRVGDSLRHDFKLRVEQVEPIEQRILDPYVQFRRQTERDLEVIERRLVSRFGGEQLTLGVIRCLAGQIDLKQSTCGVVGGLELLVAVAERTDVGVLVANGLLILQEAHEAACAGPCHRAAGNPPPTPRLKLKPPEPPPKPKLPTAPKPPPPTPANPSRLLPPKNPPRRDGPPPASRPVATFR